MNSNLNNYKTRILALLLIVAAGATIVSAQTNADNQYIQKLDNNLRKLKQEAEIYKEKVKSLNEDLKNVPDEDPEDAKNRDKFVLIEEQEKKDSQKIKEIEEKIKLKNYELSRLKGNTFDDKVKEFVIDLLNQRCNPEAIASLKGCEKMLTSNYKDDFKRDMKVLRNYENYCKEIGRVLEDFKHDFERTRWAKQSEGVLEEFDKAWGQVGYLDRYRSGRRESIPFLDILCETIEIMRAKGFEKCEDTYNGIINKLNLSLKSESFVSPINLYQDIEQLKKQREDVESNRENKILKMRDLEKKIAKNVEINNKYNKIKKELIKTEETYKTKVESIDKALVDASLQCLRKPCDKEGNNLSDCKKVSALIDDFVQFPENKERLAQYQIILNNYENYTVEIGGFLKSKYSYIINEKDGKLTDEEKKEIKNELSNLEFYKSYYSRKDTDKTILLSEIVKDFENIIDSRDIMAHESEFFNLGPRLRKIIKVKTTETAKAKTGGKKVGKKRGK